MPDILQIFTEYFLKKIDESETGEYKIRIPQDLIEYVLGFYLKPYLAEMKVIFLEKAVEIEGTNIFPIRLIIEVGDVHWDKEQKIVEFQFDVSDLVHKFIRTPLQSLGERTKEIITVDGKRILIDFEKIFRLKPQWNSMTYALRNRVKLINVRFVDGFLELVFEKAKP